MSSTSVAIVLAIVAVIFLFKTMRTVPQGFEWTVEQFPPLERDAMFIAPTLEAAARDVGATIETETELAIDPARGLIALRLVRVDPP